MNINLVFNSGHWNFPRILGRPLLNVYYGDVFQKAGNLTASASYFKSVSKVDWEKHDQTTMTNMIVLIHKL
jgi:hypothetical protein